MVTASASTSSIFLMAHMRRCPCQPHQGYFLRRAMPLQACEQKMPAPAAS